MDGPRVRAFRAVCSATSLLDWRLQSKTLICGACLSRLSPVFPGRQRHLSTGKDTDCISTNYPIAGKPMPLPVVASVLRLLAGREGDIT